MTAAPQSHSGDRAPCEGDRGVRGRAVFDHRWEARWRAHAARRGRVTVDGTRNEQADGDETDTGEDSSAHNITIAQQTLNK